MSEVNPNNYVGATTTLVGYAAGPARAPKYDKDGSSGVLELSFAIQEGYKKDGTWVDTSTTWYTYSAAGDYAEALKAVGKGDKVRIDGAKQEGREFKRPDDTIGQAITLKFGTLTVLEKSTREGGSVADAGFIPAETAGGF